MREVNPDDLLLSPGYQWLLNPRNVTKKGCFLSSNETKLTFPFFPRDQNERTPLHLAAIKGSLRCCEVIVNKNDDCVNDLDKNKVQLFSVHDS